MALDIKPTRSELINLKRRIKQTKNAIPSGPYIIAVSVVSPFLKFKNASKETIDASDELVMEIRKALMKAGKNLSKHIRKEAKTQELMDEVIIQIKRDCDMGDYTAIEELLMSCPEANLRGFLSDIGSPESSGIMNDYSEEVKDIKRLAGI